MLLLVESERETEFDAATSATVKARRWVMHRLVCRYEKESLLEKHELKVVCVFRVLCVTF